MSLIRRFLIAPSLSRLIRKERGSSKRTEGYFAPQAASVSFVSMEGAVCHLVLATADEKERTTEQHTEVPGAHGNALLDVCNGKISYERTTLPVADKDALIDRYLVPAGLDVVSVAFDDIASARAFSPPVWFGDEVSSEAAFEPASVAIGGPPPRRETMPSNAALDAVLDLVDLSRDLAIVRRPCIAA